MSKGTETATGLAFLKKRRSGFKLNINKVLGQGKELLNQGNDANIEELEKTLEKLRNWSGRLEDINGQIGLQTDDSELEKEIEGSLSWEENMLEATINLSALEKRLKTHREEDKQSQKEEASKNLHQEEENKRLQLEQEKLDLEKERWNEEKQERQRLADAEKGRLCVEQKRLEMEQEEIKRRKEKEKASNSQMKLQKFDHPTFDGSILKWREFWDAFEAAVHKNKDMSEVDKLNFLKNKMTGKAEILLRGYALTRENYPLVIKLLEERFGGKQACVAAHHQELMNIPASTNNTARLRTTFDHMESHLRSLEAL